MAMCVCVCACVRARARQQSCHLAAKAESHRASLTVAEGDRAAGRHRRVLPPHLRDESSQEGHILGAVGARRPVASVARTVPVHATIIIPRVIHMSEEHVMSDVIDRSAILSDVIHKSRTMTGQHNGSYY